MMKRLVILSMLVSGCGLYWGNNQKAPGDDDECLVTAKEPENLVRDPNTGLCESGGGGCGTCGSCVPSTESYNPSCYGACDNLDQSDCLATASCHAEYQAGTDRSAPQFVACWDTVPGVLDTGTCTGLGAWDCADHDNCASLMTGSGGSLTFSSCIPEPASCSTTTCGTGMHCAQECLRCGSAECDACAPTCVPNATCADITCGAGTSCQLECPNNSLVGGYCVPDCVPTGVSTACESLSTEDACTARSDCDPVYVGTNCTCDDNGCTCETLTFERCETK